MKLGKSVFIVGLVMVAGLAFFRCGSDSKSDDDKDTGGSGGTAKLSAAFSSAGCAASGCHGSTGANGSATNLVTESQSKTAAQFLETIRDGKGGMPSFSTSQYSDDDNTNDHAYFKAQ